MNRVLVTGGTGFLGAALATNLANDGLDVAVTSRSAFLVHGDQIPLPFRSSDGIIQTIIDWRPDTIFHLAARYVGSHKSHDIDDLVRANIGFGTAIAEAAVVCDAQIVYTATASQRPTDGQGPASLYAALKDSFSTVLSYYNRSANLKVSHVFLYDTYGPHDPRNKLVQQLMRAAASQKGINLGSEGKLVNLVHVRDVIKGLRWVAGRDDGIVEWAIRSDDFVSLGELVRLVERVSRQTIRVQWDSSLDRGGEMFEPWIIGQSVPLEGRIGLVQGLEEIWSLEGHGDLGAET